MSFHENAGYARSDVRGGTTRTLDRYTWHSSSGDALQLIDMPGTAEADGDLDRETDDQDVDLRHCLDHEAHRGAAGILVERPYVITKARRVGVNKRAS